MPARSSAASAASQIVSSVPFICTDARRNPATCGTLRGNKKRRFDPALRAGGATPHQLVVQIKVTENGDLIEGWRCHATPGPAGADTTGGHSRIKKSFEFP